MAFPTGNERAIERWGGSARRRTAPACSCAAKIAGRVVLRQTSAPDSCGQANDKIEFVSQSVPRGSGMSSAPRSEPLAEAQLAPCHVGLVFAIDLEAGGFEDRLSGLIAIRGSKFTAKQGGLKGRGIVSVRCGVGRENAAAATAAL